MTTPKRITVVGGGFSGAIFAHYLLRESPVPVVIDLAEERPWLGAGLAYEAAAPHQITNIPAARMSVDPADPTHFARWLAGQGEALAGQSVPYPIRAAFGRYMDERVRGTTPAHPDSRLRHRRVRIDRVARLGTGLTIHAADGTAWVADAVALATGNPRPVPPAALAHLAADPCVILDPWLPGALDAVSPDARVLILGLSLTMGEAVAGLRAAGHHGPITAISRRGRLAERGLTEPAPPFGDFAHHRPATAVELLRHFRAEVVRAERSGLSWRSVLVAARAEGSAIWTSLPAAERRRFVRHLRPFWEALRHVMPGPVHDALRAEEHAGRLRLGAASLRELTAAADGLRATLHPRGSAPGHGTCESFDVVLNCTGPAYASVCETDPLWADLARAGLVRPDGLHLGIAVDQHARAIDANGVAQPDVLVLGTLARGTFGELTGVPELSRLARQAASTLVSRWCSGQATPASIVFRKAV